MLLSVGGTLKRWRAELTTEAMVKMTLGTFSSLFIACQKVS